MGKENVLSGKKGRGKAHQRRYVRQPKPSYFNSLTKNSRGGQAEKGQAGLPTKAIRRIPEGKGKKREAITCLLHLMRACEKKRAWVIGGHLRQKMHDHPISCRSQEENEPWETSVKINEGHAQRVCTQEHLGASEHKYVIAGAGECLKLTKKG